MTNGCDGDDGEDVRSDAGGGIVDGGGMAGDGC